MDASALPAQTLGDILAAALTGQPVLTPEELAQQAEEQLYVDAQWTSARALTREAAWRLGIGEEEAWTSICTVPDNLLNLLLSPQGWTAIAAMIAADNGLADPAFKPSLH